VGDVTDARKCLSPKSVCSYSCKVFKRPKLAGGESFADNIHVFKSDACAIVQDLQAFDSTIIDYDLNTACFGIKAKIIKKGGPVIISYFLSCILLEYDDALPIFNHFFQGI